MRRISVLTSLTETGSLNVIVTHSVSVDSPRRGVENHSLDEVSVKLDGA